MKSHATSDRYRRSQHSSNRGNGHGDTPALDANGNSPSHDSCMNLLQLLGLSLRSAPRNEDGTLAPPPRSDYVGLEEVTTLEAVFRALVLLQTIAGQLTLDAYKGTLRRTDLSIITRPDSRMTQREWIVYAVACLSATGNAFWQIIRHHDDTIIDIRALNPSRVDVAEHVDGTLEYTLDGRRIDSSQIAHVRYLTLPGRPMGLSPITAARRGLSGMLKVQQYGDKIFTEGGIPKGILSTDQPLTPEQVDAAAQRWDTIQNLGKTAVLPRGLKYQHIGISPADLQWLESQQFGVTKIARLFGIPPHKLAIGVKGASMTYQNIEQTSLDFMRDTLMGYLSPIEAALSSVLPRGTKARFNLDAVLRPDTKTRYEAHEIGLRAGFLTIDEVRAMEKLPPLGDSHATD